MKKNAQNDQKFLMCNVLLFVVGVVVVVSKQQQQINIIQITSPASQIKSPQKYLN
jgi:hypothetical protein